MEKSIKLDNKSKKVGIIILITFCIFLFGLIVLKIVLPKIKLNGSSTIKITYNEKYKEKGAKAKWLNKDISDRLTIKELINKLEYRERQLIMLRYYSEKTQMQVAKILGITQVQVSRIEKKILNKMRTELIS